MRTLSEKLFSETADAIRQELCAIGSEIEAQYLEVVGEKGMKAKLPIACKITLMPLGDGKVGGEIKLTVNRGKIETTSTIGASQPELPLGGAQ